MSLVYRHRNPHTLEIFYVGISSNHKRPYENGRNNYWEKYVKKHGEPIVEIVQGNLTWTEACELEIFLIKIYGRSDLNLGKLVNLTNGGEGTLGRYVSKETRLKVSEKLIGHTVSKKVRQKLSKANKGKVMPKDSIKKIKLNNPKRKIVVDIKTGKQYSSIREAAKNINISYGYLNNMLKGFRGNKTTLKFL